MPDTDLSRVGYVDGTPVALGDLKLMLEIEAELSRIRDTYFSGEGFSEESLPYLSSLLEQIGTEGISAFAAGQQSVSQDITYLKSSTTTYTITASLNADANTVNGSGAPFTLSLDGILPDGVTGSYKCRVIEGNMPSEYAKFNISGAANQTAAQLNNKTFTIAPGSAYAETIAISIENYPDTLWRGLRSFYLQFYDADNFLFQNNRDYFTIPICVAYASKPLGLTASNSQTWEDSYILVGATSNFAYQRPWNPGWRLLETKFGRPGYNESAHTAWTNLYDTHKSLYGEASEGNYAVTAKISMYNAEYKLNMLTTFTGSYVRFVNRSSPGSPIKFGLAKQHEARNNYSDDSTSVVIRDFPNGYDDGSSSQSFQLPYEGTVTNAAKPPDYIHAEIGFELSFNKDTWFSGDDSDAENYTPPTTRLKNSHIELINDNIKPKVTGVTIPAGDYYPGQIIPIVVNYSRPVDASTARLQVNGSSTLSAIIYPFTLRQFSKTHVFQYTVSKTDNTSLIITNASEAKDYFGNIMDLDSGGGVGGWRDSADSQLAGVRIHSYFMKDAVSGIQLSSAAVTNTAVQAGEADIDVTLTVSQTEAFRTKYGLYDTADHKAPFAIKLTNVTNPSNQPDVNVFPLYLSEPTPSTLTVSGVISGLKEAVSEDETYIAEIIAYEDSESPGELVYGVFGTFMVLYEEVPLLAIPDNSKTIIADLGLSAQARWFANRSLFPANFSETFKVEVFEGNFSDFTGQTPIHTGTAPLSESSYLIPENVLNTLSVGGVPSYTVRVSIKNPLASDGSSVSAVAYVVVVPQRAGVKLTKPQSAYMLDSATLDIGWAITGYESGKTTAELEVKRVSTVAGVDETQTVVTQALNQASGSYTLDPADVSGLKDTYVVTIKARNDADSPWNTDSLVLYVYNENALRLGNGNITMDNTSKVSGTLPTSTEDILKLREQLGLIEYIGINYGDYEWSQLKDMIKWASSDSSTVSVNYRQGSLYE